MQDNNVQFEEEQDFMSQEGRGNQGGETPMMVGWVLKTGMVKTEKQANVLLVILAIIFFSLSIYLLSTSF